MKLIKLVKSEVENSTYIKLAMNKTHMGPVSEDKIAQKKAIALSAAANKVRVTAGFSVKVNTDDKLSLEEASHNNQSFVFKELGDDSPTVTTEYALLLMQAWDNIFKSDGTPEYVNKLTKALEARSTAYMKLGINPTSGDKPNLTSDQRVVYNSIVGPTGFDYYEYHLAFKLAGQKKFVRSKTVKSLRPFNIDQTLKMLSSEVERLKSKITISSKQTN
jgi:hypothetical protein